MHSTPPSWTRCWRPSRRSPNPSPSSDHAFAGSRPSPARRSLGAPDARYWRDQVRGAVRFRAAIETAAQSPATYLEIGPGATLVNLGRRCLKRAEPAGDTVEWVSSLSQEGGDWSALLNAVRQLHLRGHAIRWEAFEPGNGRRVSLPTYPFQRRRWWLEPRPAGPPVAAPVDLARAGTVHPVLGERLGGEDIRFEALLDLERLSFLSDHRVFRRVVLPTTAVLEAVLAAAGKSLGFSRPVIADFLYEGALTIPPDRPIWVQLALDPSGARAAFRLESTAVDDGDDWHLNVTGPLRDDVDPVEPPPFPSHALLSDCQDISPSRFYHFLATKGLSYGPAFQGITGLWRRDDEAFARVVLPRGVDEDDYLLHPAFLDACLHLYSALVREVRDVRRGRGGRGQRVRADRPRVLSPLPRRRSGRLGARDHPSSRGRR